MIMNPTRRNRAPVRNAWLTMYSVAPDRPWLVNAKMPSVMSPKWEMEM